MEIKKRYIPALLVFLVTILALFGGCETLPETSRQLMSFAQQYAADENGNSFEIAQPDNLEADTSFLSEDGTYTSKEEVAAYLYEYGHLPDNYITKKDAQKLGWESSQGNLWDVAPGKSIGGSRFGNCEGLLPEKDGRQYYECDIDYRGGYRDAKRLVYSNDGLIYYTEDHYETFECLYE